MILSKVLVVFGLTTAAVFADQSRYGGGGRGGGGGGRGGGNGGLSKVPGGVDFSNCEQQPDGMCCVMKDSFVTSLSKEPLLECTHKNVEKCHYTYVTQFEPAQEEVCEENFEKKCQITFRQVANRETVKKCLTPLKKVCDEDQPAYGQPTYGGGRRGGNNGGGGGGGEEECRTFYESSCTTRYIEKTPGKFVGDTQCEKLPKKLCGQGCRMEQGAPECHDKEIDVLIDVPEEVCDLNPQKTCRYVTKLVPRLKPEHECTVIPQEICNLKFTPPKSEKKPLKTKWCIDPYGEVEPDETYGDTPPKSPPVGDYSRPAASSQVGYAQPAPPSYGNPTPPPTTYGNPNPPPSTYNQPIAPAPTSYAQPTGDSYSQPAPSAPSSYAQPAEDSYAQPAEDSYAQPAEDSYAQPAEDTYAQPAEDSYAQPGPAPTPGPVYYKPVSESQSNSNSYSGPSAPAQNPYSSQPSYTNKRV
ncbi:paternally-expressed gene 3 protein-like [Tigriopus californicus]|uniref:paternally-expressed gene 3 protein-like n=1 Tax=Tigriopus californicus TaxID=6832 RepID=UPI0027DA2770|nr:paternally-expressed gene 3 protein-like [Tigriopus californicus]